jgi:hypothetical protein
MQVVHKVFHLCMPVCSFGQTEQRRGMNRGEDVRSQIRSDQPQDYEFMARKIKEMFELLDELEDRLDLPEVQRRRNEPTVPLAEAKKQLKLDSMICPYCGQQTSVGAAANFHEILAARVRCEKCGKELLIVDGVPTTQEEQKRKPS